MSDLLTCPHCGFNEVSVEKNKHGRFFAQCNMYSCGAMSGYCDSKVDAIIAWNTRTESAELTTIRQQNAELVEFVNKFKRFVPLAIDGNCLKVDKIERLLSKIKGEQDD